MKVDRMTFSRAGLVVCLATSLAFLGMSVGCSEDDIVGDATAQAVEAGLNDVLATTVNPLFTFYGFVGDLASGAPARPSLGGGVSCPDMGAVCSGGGSGTCSVTGGGLSLSFDFTACTVATDDLPLTLSGNLVVTPGVPIQLSFNNMVINGSPAMNGPGSVNVVACTYVANVTTDDPASIIGTIIQCDSDDYPVAPSVLDLTLDDVLVHITFNGSSVAAAAASQDGELVANCSINMASTPPTSSCEAP